MTNCKNYLETSYPPINSRIKEIFRYVELDPLNHNTFSYEFSSTLRDIGSVFGSVIEESLTNIGIKPFRGRKYDIIDYSRFLNSEINDLKIIGLKIKSNFEEKYVYPFTGFNENEVKSKWWKDILILNIMI